jgi:glycerol-3-phosphate dehydrogenase
VFPTVEVNESQIVFTFSAIRPLPTHDDTTPGFVSRDYQIEISLFGETPLLSLVGGKWTTFRALAEHLSNDVLELVGLERVLSTATLAIGRGVDYPLTPEERSSWIAADSQGHPSEIVDTLLELYGTRATSVPAAIRPGSAELAHAPGYYEAELIWLAQNEQVLHLSDIIFRRISLAFMGEVSQWTLTEIARAVAGPLGWTAEQANSEVEAVARVLSEAHRIDIDGATFSRI